MKIDLKDEALRNAISEAILTQIDEKGRELIIADAIAKLCEKQEVRYGQKSESMIERYFGDAVTMIGQQVVKDLLENDPEVRKGIESVIRKVFDGLIADESFPQAIRNAMSSFWESKRY